MKLILPLSWTGACRTLSFRFLFVCMSQTSDKLISLSSVLRHLGDIYCLSFQGTGDNSLPDAENFTILSQLLASFEPSLEDKLYKTRCPNADTTGSPYWYLLGNILPFSRNFFSRHSEGREWTLLARTKDFPYLLW